MKHNKSDRVYRVNVNGRVFALHAQKMRVRRHGEYSGATSFAEFFTDERLVASFPGFLAAFEEDALITESH